MAGILEQASGAIQRIERVGGERVLFIRSLDEDRLARSITTKFVRGGVTIAVTHHYVYRDGATPLDPK